MEKKVITVEQGIEKGLVKIGKKSIIDDGVRFILTEDNNESQGCISIGDNTILREGCIICSGVTIGNNVMIGHNSVIRAGVVIGNNCTISHMVCIEHFSIIGNFVRISSLTHLTGRCIVEDNVQIGARVVTINDNELAWGKNPELKAPLFKKNSKVGSGATILAGKVIGENSIVGAGAVVTKDIPENVIAYGVPAYVQKEKI